MQKTPATKALLALIPWTQENSTLNRNDPTGFGVEACKEHRHWKSLNRLLKVCYVPATSTVLIAFFSSFFAAAIYSTNEANKAANTRH